MRRKILASVLVFLALLTSASAETRTERAIAPGVRFVEVHRQSPDGKPWVIYRVEIDRSAKNLAFRAMKGRDHVIGTDTVRGMARRLETPGEVIAAVNGDFYAMDNPTAGLPCGMIVRDGELLVSPGGWPSLGFGWDGTPVLGVPSMKGALNAKGLSLAISQVNRPRGANDLVLFTRRYGLTTHNTNTGTDIAVSALQPPLPLKAGVTYVGTVSKVKAGVGNDGIPADGVLLSASGTMAAALEKSLAVGERISFRLDLGQGYADLAEVLGAWPIIVRDGKVVPTKDEPEISQERHPRTAFGWNERTTFLVAVDGRQPEHSVGMDLAELGKLMAELGCKEAVNLDGGGSTTLVVRGVTVNRPSDGEDRSVSNGWALVSTAPAGKLASLRIWPETPSALTGSHVQFFAAGLDSDGSPVPVDPASVKWTTSDLLGTVDGSGLFTAGKSPRAGQVIATVGEVSAATTVNTWAAPARIYVLPTKPRLTTGGSLSLSVLALDDAGRPMAIDPLAITWTATGGVISADGKLTAGSNPGRFTVNASVGGVSASARGEIVGR